MSLSDAQLDRYARHIVLKEIGGGGQMRLLDSHVLLVGAGGIGCPALQYLAAAGVGQITMIDNDHVSASNLQRQVLFGAQDIGRPKVVVAAEFAQRINPDVTFIGHQLRLTRENGAALLAGVDVVLDGTDNFMTRLAVNDLCVAARVPLVSAAIGQFHGQIAVWRGWEADKPCYRCFVGDAHDPDDCDSCSEVGVLGAMVGMMGSWAAMEAIRVLYPFGEDASGKLHIVDGLKPEVRPLKMRKDPGCGTCGSLASR